MLRRTCLIAAAVLYFGAFGANGQPVAPTDSSPTTTAPPAKQPVTISPISQFSALTWDQRSLNLLEVGASVATRQRVTVGAFARRSDGHGRSSSNTYSAEGWRLFGETLLYAEQGTRPAISLYAEHLNDDATLRMRSSTLTATAWPDVSSTGVELRGTTQRGTITWQGRTGLYQTTVDDAADATTLLLGCGLAMPLGKGFRGAVSVTGYHESYEGSFTAYEIAGDLTLYQSHRASVAVGGHVFPGGIPMGGTDFSPMSSIGLVYGQSAAARLRSSSMGYFTLAGELYF